MSISYTLVLGGRATAEICQQHPGADCDFEVTITMRSSEIYYRPATRAVNRAQRKQQEKRHDSDR